MVTRDTIRSKKTVAFKKLGVLRTFVASFTIYTLLTSLRLRPKRWSESQHYMPSRRKSGDVYRKSGVRSGMREPAIDGITETMAGRKLGQAVTEIPYDESDSLRVGAMGRIDAFLR